jgi:hypothetical protein
MKKSFIFFLVFCSSLSALSQTNYPLIEEDNSWNVLCAGIFPFFDTVYSTVSYKLSGDTSLNTVSYKKLYESWEETPGVWNLCGFMREDSSGKVWLKMIAEEEELLMYDFSIGEGDEVQVGMDWPVTLLVDSITLISIEGSGRQKFWFSSTDNPYYQETWIEGIGSDKGIIWSGSAMIVGGFYELLCMSKSDELIYLNPEYNDCYINTVGLHEISSTSVEIYPIPAKQFLYINKTENIRLISISIIDLSGKIIQSFTDHLNCLDIHSLLPGIYFLKVDYEGGKFVKKVLIER